MLVTDLAQFLEVADGRRDDAGRAGDRLDDDGGDVAAVVQHAQPLEIVGQFGAVLGHAAAERIAPDVQRVPQVIDARQQGGAEDFAIRHDAAHRHAAEVDAVVALFAADQSRAVAFAFRAMVGEGDLQRRVDRLRAGVGEEHVGETLGRHLDDAFGKCERLVVAHLEDHRVVECRNLLLHGGDNFRVAVADTRGPETGKRVVEAPTVGRRVMVALGAADDARLLLEIAICREGHPQGIGRDGIHCAGLRCIAG